MGRRRQDNTLSLFAFQDIITGVAGVMLFILLLLVVQLAVPAAQKMQQQKNDAPAIPFPIASAQDIDQLNELREQLETLRQQTASLMQLPTLRPDATMKEIRAQLQELYEQRQEIQKQINELKSELVSKETRQKVESTSQSIEQLLSELNRLDAELEKWAGGNFIAFQTGTSIPNVWLIDLRGESAEFVHLQDPTQSSTEQFDAGLTATDLTELLIDALEDRDSSRSVVILIRPSAAGPASELLYRMQQAGYRVALELLDSETRIVQANQPKEER